MRSSEEKKSGEFGGQKGGESGLQGAKFVYETRWLEMLLPNTRKLFFAFIQILQQYYQTQTGYHLHMIASSYLSYHSTCDRSLSHNVAFPKAPRL